MALSEFDLIARYFRPLTEGRAEALNLLDDAAVITPPDIVSQLALAIPMCLLYELGLFAATHFVRHTQAPEDQTER